MATNASGTDSQSGNLSGEKRTMSAFLCFESMLPIRDRRDLNMKILRFVLSVALVFLFVIPRSGFADDGSRGKWGFDIKGFKANLQPNPGWLLGGRWASYFGTSQVYMGLGAYFGAPTGLSITKEKMYYGGIIIGTDKKFGKVGAFEASLLLGYGEGQMTQLSISENSHYVVEPSLGFGVSLGGGWRLTFAGSYLHMADAKNFSGSTFGFRFQYRSSSNPKSAND